MRVLIRTFGCKVNYADTEALVCTLAKNGHLCSHASNLWDEESEPDVVVINTCAVTEGAVKKARQFTRRCLREIPRTRLIVTGCAAREESIASQFALLGVAVLADPNSILRELGKDGSPISVPRKTRTRRFIKVQDGCNSFCAYCIVPYVRRKECKPAEEVIAEIAQSVCAGTPEIVLCGINLGLYSDPSNGFGLAQLLKRILGVLPESSRLRLSSVEPEHVTDEMLEFFAHPRLCPHLHLPLQSGSDSVLTAMKRKYDSTYYRNLVDRFRTLYPDAAVTADLMVGFPTETEEDFKATCEAVRACAFERAHIFRFSTRPGTSAGEMEQLSSAIVSGRQEYLQELCKYVTREALRRFIGEECKAAIEDNSCGYGEAYQRVRIKAYRGDLGLIPVRLDALEGDTFEGTALDVRA